MRGQSGRMLLRFGLGNILAVLQYGDFHRGASQLGMHRGHRFFINDKVLLGRIVFIFVPEIEFVKPERHDAQDHDPEPKCHDMPPANNIQPTPGAETLLFS